MKTDWKEIEGELYKLFKNEEKDGYISDLSERDWIQIARALEQFKANNLIVVVTGLLKAGKSTLVNLLAGSADVSPVGYGVDTTLRLLLSS